MSTNIETNSKAKLKCTKTILKLQFPASPSTELAAAGGHVVVCELLLDALADVHKQVDGITALSLARKAHLGDAKNGHFAIRKSQWQVTLVFHSIPLFNHALVPICRNPVKCTTLIFFVSSALVSDVDAPCFSTVNEGF